MATKPKSKKTDEKAPENFSIKNAISHTNKLLNGFDNTSMQIVKLTESMIQKTAKLEEYRSDLRQTLSGITNVAERSVQDAKLAKLNKTPPRAAAPAKPAKTASAAPKAAKPAKPAAVKPVKAAKPAAKTNGHIPVRDLVQQFIQKNGTSTAGDIYNAVKAQQSTSRASVYQVLKKHFVKKGDGVEAKYSMQNNVDNKVSDEDAAAFIERQSKSPNKDLSLS